VSANAEGCVASYGDDETTIAAAEAIQAVFERDCSVWFVFGGTAANTLGLASICRPFESVLCHAESHIEKDEAAAPEFFGGGMKLHPLPGAHGKVDLEAASRVLAQARGVHSPRPRALSITQATELGTVYSVEEIRRCCEFCGSHAFALHMDGARFANALASLGCKPADITWRAGVDVLSLGGTKNGVGFGEAVVFFNQALAAEFGWRRKQAGQLASKMRFLAAPWLGALTDGQWLRRAAHANAAARSLAAQLQALGLELAFPCQANGVFVRLPGHYAERLESEGWHFYKFLEPDVYRFMCSWRTTSEEVDGLVEALARAR
jgi:threonine aldolase